MTYLETKVPEKIEELLDNHIGSRIAFPCGQYEKINIRQGCQFTAAIASHRDKREPGIAMPRHDGGKKRLQYLVHSQRMTAHIDSPVAALIELFGKIVFQRAVNVLCRREEGGPKQLIASLAGELVQGRQPFLRYRQFTVPRGLKRLYPLPPLHDLTRIVGAGRPARHPSPPESESGLAEPGLAGSSSSRSSYKSSSASRGASMSGLISPSLSRSLSPSGGAVVACGS